MANSGFSRIFPEVDDDDDEDVDDDEDDDDEDGTTRPGIHQPSRLTITRRPNVKSLIDGVTT